jgi:hypothetical protein
MLGRHLVNLVNDPVTNWTSSASSIMQRPTAALSKSIPALIGLIYRTSTLGWLRSGAFWLPSTPTRTVSPIWIF